MTSYLWVAVGGAVGSVTRFWLSGVVDQRWETFPWGTMAVNVTGSVLIGMLAALSEPHGRWFVSSELRQFLMIGVCGGYTTFSSFSLQTLNLARDGEWLPAAMNVALSVVLCLAGVWLGNSLALSLNSLKTPTH